MKPHETHALGAVGVGDKRGRRQYLNYDLKEKSNVPQGFSLLLNSMLGAKYPPPPTHT